MQRNRDMKKVFYVAPDSSVVRLPDFFFFVPNYPELQISPLPKVALKAKKITVTKISACECVKCRDKKSTWDKYAVEWGWLDCVTIITG